MCSEPSMFMYFEPSLFMCSEPSLCMCSRAELRGITMHSTLSQYNDQLLEKINFEDEPKLSFCHSIGNKYHSKANYIILQYIFYKNNNR